jgi:hypothetical protein
VAVSPTFAALRDGATSGLSPADQDRAALFEQVVFPELEGQGFAREELQLAWDFGTVSLESSLGPAIQIRDDALARAGDAPPYVIDSVEYGDCTVPSDEPIARTINGHFTSPRYTELDGPGATLLRDPSGAPLYAGDTEVAFLARIPCSLLEPGEGGRVLQYGHGLFGDLGEARGSYLAQLADRNRWVLFAQNWTGMSAADLGQISLMAATDLSGFETIPDRTLQGFGEWAVGARLARGALASDPAFLVDGQPVIDPSLAPVYYGNSQGAILGGAYAALSPDIERVVLGVGGMPYSLLLQRSVDFEAFITLFRARYNDDREIALLIAALQTVWDPAESGGYANVLTHEGIPGVPPKRVLMQVAVGDAQVSTLGAQLAARAWGASTVGEPVRPIWGVPEVAGAHEGSALIEWEYADVPPEPLENLPPEGEADPHECPRREPAGQDQLSLFLETGTVEPTCVGPCLSVRAGLCD